ncbi:MAG: response regulator [Bacilli bacterium]|nr:response regulator [Bacilli bacterium]
MKKLSTKVKAIIGVIATFIVVTVTSIVLVVLNANGVFNKDPSVTITPKNTFSETLHVATDHDYEPFSYIEKGEYKGLDVELIAEVANRMEMNLDLKLMDWEDCQTGLKNGTYDIILNMESNAILKDDDLIGTIPTDEKQYVVYGKKAVNYVGELYGMKVAAYNTFDELGMKIITGYTYQEMFEMILTGELDYVICPIQVGNSFVDKLNARNVIVSSYQVSYMYGCMALKSEDTALCSRLNDVIKELQVEGFIKMLDNKWVTSRYQNVSFQDFLGRNPIVIILFVVLIQMILIAIGFAVYTSSTSKKQKAAAEELQKNLDIINRQNEELVEANQKAEAANKAKSEFLSNMSHDIRTPMNAIIGMSEIAEHHIDDKEKVKDCIHKIDLSSKQLLGLINDILDMSKIESGKLVLNNAKVSLREIVASICEIIKPGIKDKKQKFDVTIGNIDSENIYADEVRINQVLLNLLSNAMKFTDYEGEISLSIFQEKSEKGEGHVKTHFIVKDNGIGMSKEFQTKLFTAFEREDNKRIHKTQGTGLGMSIVKHIVDMMGGTIAFESELGVGTTFHVTVDFESFHDDGELSLEGCKILVVDDNKDLCLSAVENIEQLHAVGEYCTSGKEALEKVKSTSYFAILVDYRLEDMNGIELIKELRKVVDDGLPICLISAYDGFDFEDEAKEAGASRFIPKPLFKSTIYQGLVGFTSKEESSSKENEKLDLAGMRILVAEDQYINAEIMMSILEDRGCLVEIAEDGRLALEAFKSHDPGYYQVILMDLRMPNMNGFEATAAIRGLRRKDAAEIPIIALTADAFAEDAQKCLDVGMNAHLSKPIDIELLELTLQKILHNK